MNKKLIKEFKAEFEHWLNGGEGILAYCYVFTGKKYQWSAMYEESDVFESREEDLYDIKAIVLNDNYVELRKALAEGKTIQYDATAYSMCNRAGEHSWTEGDIKFDLPLWAYRIKPEEQFKVGDFVRNDNIGTVRKYSLSDLEYDEKATHTNNWIKWLPQASELCWFTNNKNINKATLDTFHSMGAKSYKTDTAEYSYCEPFLNSTPSWFKE